MPSVEEAVSTEDRMSGVESVLVVKLAEPSTVAGGSSVSSPVATVSFLLPTTSVMASVKGVASSED